MGPKRAQNTEIGSTYPNETAKIPGQHAYVALKGEDGIYSCFNVAFEKILADHLACVNQIRCTKT